MDSTQKSISDVQAYWNARPCNVRHSTSPIMRQYSDEVTERKYFVEPHIPEFAEFWKWRGKWVLEIGCGIGTDALNFARAGAHVSAIDLSEKSLEIARKRAAAEFLNINFRQQNAEELCPPDPAYHLIYAFGSIHHSPDPEAIVRKMRQASVPGQTTLKIMVYNKWSWKSLWILLKYGHGKLWKFRELIAKYSEAQTGCPVTHVYSPRELRAMLERNGFTVRKMYKDHIFKFDVGEYIQYRYKLSAPWKWLPKTVHRWLERHFGWHLMAEAVCS